MTPTYMEVKATLRYYRQSPRKVRLALDLVRGIKVEEALSQLKFLNKKAARAILKLLNSAIANAEHNFNLEKSNLYIKKIFADSGPTLKRWMPKAFGRADPIRKRSSQITIVLDEIVPTKKEKIKTEKKEEEIKVVKNLGEVKVKQETPEKEDVTQDRFRSDKKEEKKKPSGGARGFLKKIFSRKAI